MTVTIEPCGPLLRLSPAKSPRERAAVVWSRLSTGRSIAAIAAWRSDLSCFGRSTWRDAHVIRTIARVLEALDGGHARFGELARAHIDSERVRGCAAATLARRWGTFVALARAIDNAEPRRARIELGPRPVERGRVDARQIVTTLLLAHEYRDACIIGLVAETRMRREQITQLRMRELAQRGGSVALRRAITEHTRGRPASAWAFEGRARGSSCTRKTIDRVCERHGTSVVALRRERSSER